MKADSVIYIFLQRKSGSKDSLRNITSSRYTSDFLVSISMSGMIIIVVKMVLAN